MRRPVQLTLNLKTEQSYSPEDFIVSSCNNESHAYISSWPNWHSHCCILYGATGSGKTHLANVWRYYNNAKTIRVQDVSNLHDLCRQNKAIIIEYDPAVPEEQLFHLYNISKEHGSYLLILAEKNVAALNIALPDLNSRLMSCPQFKMDLPDEQMIRMLIVKHFVDCNMPIEEKSVDYIANHTTRSYQAIKDFVHGLSQYLQAAKVKPTLYNIKNYMQLFN